VSHGVVHVFCSTHPAYCPAVHAAAASSKAWCMFGIDIPSHTHTCMCWAGCTSSCIAMGLLVQRAYRWCTGVNAGQMGVHGSVYMVRSCWQCGVQPGAIVESVKSWVHSGIMQYSGEGLPPESVPQDGCLQEVSLPQDMPCCSSAAHSGVQPDSFQHVMTTSPSSLLVQSGVQPHVAKTAPAAKPAGPGAAPAAAAAAQWGQRHRPRCSPTASTAPAGRAPRLLAQPAPSGPPAASMS
jgi:hypothetical protein